MKAKLATHTWTEIQLSRPGNQAFGRIGFFGDDDKLLEVTIEGMDRSEADGVAAILAHWASDGELKGDDES